MGYPPDRVWRTFSPRRRIAALASQADLGLSSPEWALFRLRPWCRTAMPPSNAARFGSPGRFSTGRLRGRTTGLRRRAQPWKARSASSLEVSPPSFLATTTQTPSSPNPPRRANALTRSTSSPGRISCGEGCLPIDGAWDISKALDLLTEAHQSAAINGYGTVERRAATAPQLLDAALRHGAPTRRDRRDRSRSRDS
jgi:hypothetical protein